MMSRGGYEDRKRRVRGGEETSLSDNKKMKLNRHVQSPPECRDLAVRRFVIPESANIPSPIEREEELRPVDEIDIQNCWVFQIALMVADFLFNTHRYVFAIDLYEEIIGLVSLLASSSGLSLSCTKNEFDVYVNSMTEELEMTKRSLQSKHAQEKEASSDQDAQDSDAPGVANEQNREIAFYETLGSAFYSLGRYQTSIWYFETAAEMIKATAGNKSGEQRIYTSLAIVYNVVSQFDKAFNLQEKALHLSQEIGDLKGELECYNNLGSLCNARGQFNRAISYYSKALDDNDRMSAAMAHNNLGNVYLAEGQYNPAIDHYRESLQIRKVIDDTKGISITCNNLGCVFYALGQYETAIMYLEEALEISEAIGAKKQVAVSYSNLGGVYDAYGKHKLSLENHDRGLKIRKEIGDSAGECRCYKEISSVHDALGQLRESFSYQEKAQKLERTIINKQVKVVTSSHWIAHKERGLESIEEIGVGDSERLILYKISLSHTSRVNCHKVSNHLAEDIEKHEVNRLPLSQEHKLSLDEQSVPLYRILAVVQISSEHYTDALLSLERGRARALVDLILRKYAIQEVATTKFDNLSAITSFFANQGRNFLFMAILMDSICLWLIDMLGNLTFKSYFVTQKFLSTLESAKTAEEVAKILTYSSEEDERSFLHSVVFGLVDHLPDDEEIIFVPEGPMFQLPFALLQNANRNYLAEKVRLRVIPSITTLAIIRDLPADYHHKTGAMLVAYPCDIADVTVKYHNKTVKVNLLPFTKKEVEMIADVLGEKESCLVDKKATKGEVLRRISNVCLVHFAVHGNSEDGSIILADDESEGEEGCILTAQDVANVGIAAKLVVLSSCHSARGRILNAEGIVGFARSFLGCGARSVLASMWAIDDEATLAFMTRFYKYLIGHNMSASRALRQAMREMIESDQYNKVIHWAPFVLYGDDVTLDWNENHA